MLDLIDQGFVMKCIAVPLVSGYARFVQFTSQEGVVSSHADKAEQGYAKQCVGCARVSPTSHQQQPEADTMN